MTKKRFNNHNESIINSKTNELVNASSDISAEIIVDWLNELNDKNKKLKCEVEKLKSQVKELYNDLVDHSALISMLEDYQALKIEDTLFNLTGVKSNEEFDALFKLYLKREKERWRL